MKKINLFLFALTALLSTACLNNDNSTSQDPIYYDLESFDSEKLGDSGVAINKSFISKAGYIFDNYYADYGSYQYNSGFTHSNKVDYATAGAENQYSVYSASSTKDNQFLIFNPPYGSNSYIHRQDGKNFCPYTAQIALTTYTMLSVLNGDSYARKFTDKDTLEVRFQGYDAYDQPIKNSYLGIKMVQGTKLFSMSDTGYFLRNLAEVYPTQNNWITVPLYYLGEVNKIGISFISTDKSEYGNNTPEYIALDDFATITMETMATYKKTYLNE